MFAAMRRATPVLGLMLLLIAGFGMMGRSWLRFHRHARNLVGVVSGVDARGEELEIRTLEPAGRSRLERFRLTRGTQIRAQGRRGSLGDLQAGKEVVVTYLTARLPRSAERIDVR